MEEIDRLKSMPKSEIIKEIIQYYGDRVIENQLSHENLFEKEFEVIDKIISTYFCISLVIREATESDKYKRRFFFAKQYISTITDNFYMLKELFQKGFHIQLQLLIRSQIEYVNNLISFIGDDSFFQSFCIEENNKYFISPKPVHSEKVLKRIFKEYNPENYSEETWKVYKKLINSLYSDLSESAHGNIVRIVVQSLSGEHEDMIGQNICGAKIPIPATVNILRNALNFFQIATRILWIQIEKKEMIDKESSFLDFVLYSQSKIKFMNEK